MKRRTKKQWQELFARKHLTTNTILAIPRQQRLDLFDACCLWKRREYFSQIRVGFKPIRFRRFNHAV